MASPTIFSGNYTKLLTSGGVQMQNGMIIENNGPINYIKNYGAEVGTTGWATYADTAANIPADGTGGTATGLTFSRSTSSPIAGSAQFSMVQANSTSIQGKGVSYDFTIDSAYKAQVLQIAFSYNASSTFVASNGVTAPLNDGTTTTNAGNSDIEVFIYDVTNAVLLPVSPQVIVGNGTNNFQFSGTFQTSSNSTSYRLILHVATTSANATGWTFLFDNVYVGPQTLVQGAPLTDPITFTPTITGFGTLSAVTAYYYREGKFMIGEITAVGGTVSGSTFDLTIPGGLSVDTAYMSSTSNGQTVGYLDHATSGSTSIPSNSNGPFYIFYDGSTTTKLYCANATTSQAYTKNTGSNILSNSNPFTIKFRIPIAGWASNVQMSNDTSTRVVAARATTSTTTIGTSATDIVFTSTAFDTHSAYNSSTGVYTVPVSGYYRVSSMIGRSSATTSSANNGVQLNLFKNGSLYETLGYTLYNAAVSIYITVNGSAIVNCTAGDTLKISGTRDAAVSSAALDGTSAINWVSFERISGPAQIASVDTVAAKYNTSTQTLNTTPAVLNCTVKEYDTHGSYSSGVFTVPVSGKYMISSSMSFYAASSANNNGVYLIARKNSTAISNLGVVFSQGSSAFTMNPSGSTIIQCVAGDTLDVAINRDSSIGSGALNSGSTNSWVCFTRVGN